LTAAFGEVFKYLREVFVITLATTARRRKRTDKKEEGREKVRG